MRTDPGRVTSPGDCSEWNLSLSSSRCCCTLFSVQPVCERAGPVVRPFSFPSTQLLKLSDLPAAVQATVRQQGAENQIADIDSYTRNGKRVYEVEFKKEGLNHEIHVGEDGKVIDNSALGAPGHNSGAAQGTDRSTGERTPPPSGNGTVPNPTREPTDVK